MSEGRGLGEARGGGASAGGAGPEGLGLEAWGRFDAGLATRGSPPEGKRLALGSLARGPASGGWGGR